MIMQKKILIVGATSGIAMACARIWASQGARMFLVARNGERLRQVADDLQARGAALATTHVLDINALGEQHAAMLDECKRTFGGPPDVVLIAPGTLPDQAQCQADPAVAVREFSTNATSVIALLTLIANMLETARHGAIGVIGSVAGDRGRPSNYLYGSAKAALAAFCEGLRARLYKAGVHVVTIKPGFVATAMTAGLPLPSPLVASPDKVANEIVRAIDKKKNVLYTPCFWSPIMRIIRSIPQFVFKRLSL
ncbi:short-chain dehydrogenase [Burkholderia ubonensis]|uniref:SDR family oxidoreductase n=1 Tax=Burkholderia ubonensis TaxID=101571 RepID=UPI0008FE5791|nr:SDR family oxidoreductase [Burkholderia ubonensis]OJB41394.1 short-chain dehydrogenase [Burkholderia ubonensis]OJB55955.1 short-chain dehydrogenase [Burkholderia ubonensis]